MIGGLDDVNNSMGESFGFPSVFLALALLVNASTVMKRGVSTQ